MFFLFLHLQRDKVKLFCFTIFINSSFDFFLRLQNLDDPLEEASDKLFFEHFNDCYAAFHHGRDDYSEEIGYLEEKFMQVYEINNNVAEELVSLLSIVTL